MSVVQTRFHVPAAMLQRILIEADPVVTCSDDRLRFEGFSGCCGVYARVDLLPNSVCGETFGRGTTNVDFNQPMLSALATIRNTDDLSLTVGTDQVELSKNNESVIEKKVKLPIRWLKGFVEVQACQSRMQLVHEVSGVEALRFIRSLPRSNTHNRENWIVSAGRGLRISQQEGRPAVRVDGLKRLHVLEKLAARAKQLQIYSDDKTGATAWSLRFDDANFHLVISPEVWRGFSGEGQALESFASKKWESVLPLIRANLKWNSVIDVEELSAVLSSEAFVADTISFDDTNSIKDALAVLGVHGLAGYDLAESAYFHRELPFDMDSVEKLQPRLKSARKLIDEKKVRLDQSGDTAVAYVSSRDIEHRVRLTRDDAKCTCTWFVKHATNRGPCKHILAAQIMIEEANSE